MPLAAPVEALESRLPVRGEFGEYVSVQNSSVSTVLREFGDYLDVF